jgi:hypothetical protein
MDVLQEEFRCQVALRNYEDWITLLNAEGSIPETGELGQFLENQIGNVLLRKDKDHF